MAAEREITDDELLDVADNPAQAASLHKALRTIANNPSVGPQLQEMARAVLSGRIGMREAFQSDRYLGAIGDRLTQIREAAERMSPEERRASEERARKMREAEESKDAAKPGSRKRN
jgi:hypothetical protein